IIGILGRRGVGRTALTQRFNRGVEILRGNAGAGENSASVAVLFKREREQQPLHRHVTVAGLLGDLFGLVENTRQGRIEVNLPSSTARNLGALGERSLDRSQRLA